MVLCWQLWGVLRTRSADVTLPTPKLRSDLLSLSYIYHQLLASLLRAWICSPSLQASPTPLPRCQTQLLTAHPLHHHTHPSHPLQANAARLRAGLVDNLTVASGFFIDELRARKYTKVILMDHVDWLDTAVAKELAGALAAQVGAAGRQGQGEAGGWMGGAQGQGQGAAGMEGRVYGSFRVGCGGRSRAGVGRNQEWRLSWGGH